MVLALRGTAFLYYGDELGLADTDDPRRPRPRSGRRSRSRASGAIPERTPMPWSAAPGAGFTEPGVEPWLPFGDLAAANVEDQRRDPGSTLSFTRDLIQLRAAIPELRTGAYATVRRARRRRVGVDAGRARARRR